MSEIHAFVTKWPSVIEGRTSTGTRLAEPLGEDEVGGLGRFFKTLLDLKVDTIEVRVENTDD